MAIRFHCQRCQQLLGIATRKAGTEIACPKCGATQLVPDQQTARVALAMAEGGLAEQVEGESDPRAPFFDDLDLDFPPRGGVSPPEPAIPQLIETTPLPLGAQTASSGAGAGPLVDGEMVLYHRRTLYLQGALLAVLAVMAFAAGYLTGRGGLTFGEADRPGPIATEVAMEGSLVWEPQRGRTAMDEGAVVIALPVDPPDSRLSIRGLRPQDPEPTADHPSVKMIEQFGGVYARADVSGSVPLVFPKEGKYHVLLISRHAARADDSPIDEADREGIEKYFHQASILIGRYKYRWTLEEIQLGRDPIEHSFGPDEQPGL